MKNAYTLIEIVIVIAIIGMMALVSIPAFGKYELKNNLESKAEEITSLFNRAYLLSQSPVRMTDGTIERTCDSVLVELASGTFTIVLKRTDSAGLIDCVSVGSQNRIASVVVSDNTVLDTLGLEDVIDTNWQFNNNSIILGDADFNLRSSELGRSINFKLKKINNIFTIKNDI